jgi:hypothetical protein
MKKALFVCAMSLSALFINAQKRSHLEVGLKGGLNIASLIQKNTDYKSRLSFNAGGFANLRLAEHLAIQPELLYTSQGAKNTFLNQEFETRLGYFAVPVLFQYITNSGFRLETGPQFGVLVNAKSEVLDVETDIKNNLKEIDASWALGASYVTQSGFGVNGRYNFGLTDIADVANTPSLKNSVFQVGIFYQFKAL